MLVRWRMWGLVGLLAGAAAACADGLSVDGPPEDDDDGSSSGLGTGGSSLQSGAGGDTSATSGPSSTSSTPAANTNAASTGSGTPQLADLIDDLESGTGSILSSNGRVGAWYTYNDETPQGVQTPLMGMTFVPAGPGYMSTLGAQTVGSGFSAWGAGMGFDLNNNGVIRLPYDVSTHGGIIFWARGNASVRMKLPTTTITPVAESGTCPAQSLCSDAHGVAVALTSSWTQYAIAFSQLAQEGWGLAAPFEPAKVLAIQFQVAANVGFDFWIDDIGFY